MDFIMLGLGVITGAGLMFMHKCNCDTDRVNEHVREGTQAYMVRQHLESGNKIDHQYAREHFGIKNLSSAVDKLRKSGVDVKAIKDDSGRFYSL